MQCRSFTFEYERLLLVISTIHARGFSEKRNACSEGEQREATDKL